MLTDVASWRNVALSLSRLPLARSVDVAVSNQSKCGSALLSFAVSIKLFVPVDNGLVPPAIFGTIKTGIRAFDRIIDVIQF